MSLQELPTAQVCRSPLLYPFRVNRGDGLGEDNLLEPPHLRSPEPPHFATYNRMPDGFDATGDAAQTVIVVLSPLDELAFLCIVHLFDVFVFMYVQDFLRDSYIRA
jgi:hypothetical protein